MTEKRLTPEEVLINAFEYFETDTLDLESLITVALAANCPSAEIAQGVLNQLVSKGMLSWRKDNEKVLFTIIKKAPPTDLVA